MSESSTTSTHPFAHLIGAPVHLPPEAREATDIQWDSGIIVCAMSGSAGLIVHVANPETGQVLPAIRLESLRLNKETLELIQAVNKMAVFTTNMISNQFGSMSD